nr:U32 family peptidase [uncultured Anaeromusa sp.]
MKLPELLAPAGNLEKLKTALLFGADAVYVGGKSFSLRAQSDNFDFETLQEGVRYAHELGKKVYVALNVFAHQKELQGIASYLPELQAAQVDAVIVADPGVFRLVRKQAPNLAVHISTQANTVNAAAACFWEDLGAKRVVLAREVTYGELLDIRSQTDVQLETFVHGAMCVSYSGRCLLSNYFTGRDANRGACTQPCRWKYALQEETRPGQFYPIEEDAHGTYFMNSKDLCLLPHLPALVTAGVNSLKIEGRMKSIHYVATVVRVYRQALDLLAKETETFAIRPAWLEELQLVSQRAYTDGFFQGPAAVDAQVYAVQKDTAAKVFCGVVTGHNGSDLLVEQRGHFTVGDCLEALPPTGELQQQRLRFLWDAKSGAVLERAPHAQQQLRLAWDEPLLPVGTLLRRVLPSGEEA